MDVLRHPGVGGFGRPVLCEVHLCAHARLQGPVGLTLRPEEGGMQARIQRHAAAQPDIVLDIQVGFVADLGGVALHVDGGVQLDGAAGNLLGKGGQGFRNEGVEGVFGPELNLLGRGGGVVEIDLRHPVAHARTVVKIILVVVDGSVRLNFLGDQVRPHLHLVAVVGDRRVRKEFRIHHMVPAERRHGIAPADAQVLVICNGTTRHTIGIIVRVLVIEVVQTVVHVEIQAVPVAETMRQLGVEVVEEIVSVETGQLQNRCQQERVHAAAADGVGGLSLPEGAFEVQFVADHADAEASVRLIEIAVVRPDIEDAGDAAAVAGREGSLVQRNLLHGFRLENGENAQHVLGIVDGNAVQHEQVLVRSAAPDVKAGEAFRSALHAGEHLNGFQDIGLAEEGRGALDGGNGHLDGAHLGGLNAGFLLGGDDRFLQRCARNQCHIDSCVLLRRNGNGLRRITDVGIGNLDLFGTLGDGQRVETEVIGHGAVLSDRRARAD